MLTQPVRFSEEPSSDEIAFTAFLVLTFFFKRVRERERGRVRYTETNVSGRDVCDVRQRNKCQRIFEYNVSVRVMYVRWWGG